MSRFLIFLAMAIACVAAQPIEEVHQENIKAVPFAIQARTVYDEYTLGQQVDGARIIYSYQSTQSFENYQPEITLEFSYPSEGQENNAAITQVTLYLEAADGASTQAYVTSGGIGETSITLNMVAHDSNSLRYMVVIYGKQN